MMEYITRKQYFPGALSDAAAELLKKIYEAGVYFPSWVDMSKDEIAAFDELMPGYYVESCAYYGYRVKGTSYVDSVLSRVREQVSQRNQELFVLYAGVDPLVAKWEAKIGIKDFRMRPWREDRRVREAHLQLESDIKLTLSELRRAG
jgi:hypothetical protein